MAQFKLMKNPLWRILPAEIAHSLAPIGIKIYSELFENKDCHWNSFRWRGHYFKNRLGLAGGADKNGELLESWEKLGAGFIEIGTITPRPQKPNPGKILDRDWAAKNLWNKMGFPNDGMDEVRAHLETVKPNLRVPLFINIGKNRSTENSNAHEDYARVAKALSPFCEALVINISSPNTQGLRDLRDERYLTQIIQSVRKVAGKAAVFLKLSPDESDADFAGVIKNAFDNKIDGLILTNTTRYRPADCAFPSEGGLSGQDLKHLSLHALALAKKLMGEQHISSQSSDPHTKPLLISVGGILTPQDVAERLSLGADLVQIYSALVFSGPGFFKKVADANE
jgi:dihydroorotate dehydrogenase